MARRARYGPGGLWLSAALLFVLVVAIGLVLAREAQRRRAEQDQPAATLATAEGAGWRQHVYMGLPQPEARYRLLVNAGYVVGYSETRQDPLWAAYRLFPVPEPPHLPRPRGFTVDERTAAGVKPTDYRAVSDRFDRGHMAPNHAIATRYGREAQVETFLMSNICPQAACLNEGPWEAFEKVVADDYAAQREVYVITGPVFADAPERLPAGVEVPAAFYTIVVDPAGPQPEMLAIIMDQAVEGEHPLSEFVTTVAEVERRTGLDFFRELPAEIELAAESATPAAAWGSEQRLRPTQRCRLERRTAEAAGD